MSHNCFISFKKEDIYYRDQILKKLGSQRILGKSLEDPIPSNNIDYVMREIREKYMYGTSVTIFLIGEHSKENEGFDTKGDKNAFIKRELQATLYDGHGFRRSGLLGVVLPSMERKIYKGPYTCSVCGGTHNCVSIDDSTVIREFSVNYYLKEDGGCYYSENGRFCVLARYSEFMSDPDKYIDQAYDKLDQPICNEVHWRNLRD